MSVELLEPRWEPRARIRSGRTGSFGRSMEFTRHARNGMRWLDLSDSDVERIVSEPEYEDTDADGRPRYTGRVRGRLVRVVVALDTPDLVITVHPKRKT